MTNGKMKILWLCNVMIPQVCKELHITNGNTGGWLTQPADFLDGREDVELGICAPYGQNGRLTKAAWGNGSLFWGFQGKSRKVYQYDRSLETLFQEIIGDFQPDIVHIFGTEFPHTLAMVRAFGRPERTVIHIQGLVSIYARHYCAYLPHRVTKKYTFRDLARHDNILRQKRKFELRGRFETEAIARVGHVMGRTDWDRACCKRINPSVHYHHVQEMMRPEFYGGQWCYKDCEKHSIFISQGNYPIKGLHLALEALWMLKAEYPDVKLYIAGADIIHYSGLKQKIRKTYYAEYITELIQKWDLERQVVFTGPLDAAEMKERYLSCHVFLSPSVIENSPNSIGEAMLLGVPIVASDVGGVSSLLDHKKEGFLYPADEPLLLLEYVKRIFEDSAEAEKLGREGRTRAGKQYDSGVVIEELLDSYQIMMCSGE